MVQRTAAGPETGALPDFVIIGAQKGGTTSLYQLLARHPHVQRAAAKELHFFDNLYEEGVEWYRQCFPAPKWKDGRETITGEASPAYLFVPHVPERMAEVVPRARLIALLRNPVDRAYSHYHHQIKLGRKPSLKFEEAMELEARRLRGESDETFEDKHLAANHRNTSFLARGIYVDQLLRWSQFYGDEQLLVLKSEDFFERPQDSLKAVLDYLDLPDWEPKVREVRNRNKGEYKQEMNPDTRRRLEEFFEPHNRRLYDYLGVDFGW